MFCEIVSNYIFVKTTHKQDHPARLLRFFTRHTFHYSMSKSFSKYRVFFAMATDQLQPNAYVIFIIWCLHNPWYYVLNPPIAVQFARWIGDVPTETVTRFISIV